MSYPQYPGYGAPSQGPPQPYGGYNQPPPGQQYGGYNQPPPGQQYGGYNQPPPGQQYGGYNQPPPGQQYGHQSAHSPYPQQGYPPHGHSPHPQQPFGTPQYTSAAQPYGLPTGPPPQNGPPFGALPSPSYNAPPGPAGGSYAAPSPQYFGPPTQATLGYGPPQLIQWDAKPDARALHSAMKGFGTNEKALIRILSTKDPLQVEKLRSEFMREFNRSLEGYIAQETSSWFGKGLVALVQGPLLHDCHLLRDATDGLGTKEKVLNDVLLSRSNADMHAIKSKYQQTFGKALESDIQSDLSMKTKRHFLIVLGGHRAEDSAPVVPQNIDSDVMDLYRATEGKVGTDELLVCSILSTRNDNQIRAINHAYEQKFRKRLADVIRKEFSGHMEDTLLYQLNHAVDKYMHAAALLEETMAGLGTKDNLLTSRVVRYHWDRPAMGNIKGAYEQRYHKSLATRIKGETSGDYERLLIACIG